MQQKPSIGRIVIFTLDDVQSAAMITKVHSDTCVNLRVFPDRGPIIERTSVVIDDAHRRLNPRWSWPERT
jgi:hypothetical protein